MLINPLIFQKTCLELKLTQPQHQYAGWVLCYTLFREWVLSLFPTRNNNASRLIDQLLRTSSCLLDVAKARPYIQNGGGLVQRPELPL